MKLLDPPNDQWMLFAADTAADANVLGQVHAYVQSKPFLGESRIDTRVDGTVVLEIETRAAIAFGVMAVMGAKANEGF